MNIIIEEKSKNEIVTAITEPSDYNIDNSSVREKIVVIELLAIIAEYMEKWNSNIPKEENQNEY